LVWWPPRQDAQWTHTLRRSSTTFQNSLRKPYAYNMALTSAYMVFTTAANLAGSQAIHC
jgi:hypothetical protein